MDTAAAECAREYYRALDDHDYGAIDGLLADGFVHDRPDRTFDGRDQFVRFMREERPNRDTTHRIEGVYHSGSGRPGSESEVKADVVVQGRLLDDGEVLFEFVDLFDVDGGQIARVDTYARSV